MLFNQDATSQRLSRTLRKEHTQNELSFLYSSCNPRFCKLYTFHAIKAVERSKLVEDLLDISIFSTMGDILKKKISNHTVEVRENNHEIELLEERINGLNEQLNALRENRDAKIKT